MLSLCTIQTLGILCFYMYYVTICTAFFNISEYGKIIYNCTEDNNFNPSNSLLVRERLESKPFITSKTMLLVVFNVQIKKKNGIVYSIAIINVFMYYWDTL